MPMSGRNETAVPPPVEVLLLVWQSVSRCGAGPCAARVALALRACQAEAEGAVWLAVCGGSLRISSGAAALSVKRDRAAWLRERADSVAAQANAECVHSGT